MPVILDLFLTSAPLYSNLVNYFDQTNEGSAETTTIGIDLKYQLVKPFSGTQAKQLLIDYRKAKNDAAILVYFDDDYEEVQKFSDFGWRTILYNPRGKLTDVTLPVQDADILSYGAFNDLEKLLLKKPTLQKCFDWWDEWDVPDNIRLHATRVARAAYVLAIMLRNQGKDIDPILAHRGGLLHDIDKISTLNLSGEHGAQGAKFLYDQGYHELAEIVRGHIMSSILESDFDNRGWESKLVFFCDKLVEGERIISFDQRLKALKNRYPDYVEVMSRAENCIWKLNDEICSTLSIPSHKTLISNLRKLQ